jgi:hypothetical protein
MELQTFEIEDACILQHHSCIVTVFSLICVHTPCFSWICKGMISGDLQWPVLQAEPIHWSGTYPFSYSVLYRMKCGVPSRAGSISVIMFCVIQDT